MWLAVIMVCSTMSATSCIVAGNTDNVWFTEEECKDDVMTVANAFLSQGMFVKPNCFKVGDSV